MLVGGLLIEAHLFAFIKRATQKVLSTHTVDRNYQGFVLGDVKRPGNACVLLVYLPLLQTMLVYHLY